MNVDDRKMDLNKDTNMDNSSESSNSEEEVYDVEKVVSHKKQHGKVLYRIRWVNYNEEADTWEPESNLLGDTAQNLLKEYKAKHNIDMPKSASKPKNWEYVSDTEEGHNQWIVSSTDKRAEVRNLFVQDRILDQTERFLANNFGAIPRMTRAQLKTILPEDENKRRTSNESTDEPSKERRSRKKHLPTESPPDVEKIKPKKAKTAKPKKVIAESSNSEEGRSVTPPPPKPKKPTPSPSVVKEKPTMAATAQVRQSPKKPPVKPVSMLGKDPKQGVNARLPGDSISKSLSTFRIPKKQSTVNEPPKLSKSPQKLHTKKVESPKFFNHSIPKAAPIKQKLSTSSTENPPATTSYKPTQWRPAENEKIREKECILPGTRLGLNATLNIDPAQLTSYHLLSVDTSKSDKISQQDFNQAVLSGKIGLVRAALRNKANVFDMDSSDARGKTLLHRLAEMNCDQQHSQDEIIDCLANAGASMSITENDFSRTPLHLAVISRRSCHVRKLVELGSPINTVDSRNESPLITALKMNNVELAKYLLHAGATYQGAFSQKLALSKTQQKPVTNYQNALQECISKALQTLSFDFKMFFTLSPVFQTPLYESHQLDFIVNLKSDFNLSNVCPILVTALIDNSDRMTANLWGESPVDTVYLNGRKLEYAQEGNKFIYLATAFGQQSSVNIGVDRTRAQYSKRILAAQLFGFRMEFENI